ncbi:MAG: sulfate permease [Sporichthyaceae bacterium]
MQRQKALGLSGNLAAGVTVAAYLIPQVMAYSQVAGVPPMAGLWTAVAAMLVYALIGSSTQLSVGPESTTALMVAVAIAPLAAGDADRYVALASLLALMVGAVCLLARVARLGFLADLLSKPVLLGYLAGVAALMAIGQLGRVTRLEVDGNSSLAQLESFARGAERAHWPTVVLAAGVLAALLLLHRRWPRSPAPLVVVLLATAAVAVFGLRSHGIDVVGPVSGLPRPPALTTLRWEDVANLLVPAVAVVLVGFTDNVLTARAFAVRRHRSIDGNRELAALGAANLAAGAVGGYPVSSSGSRTALADAAGARSQLYSVVAAGTVVLAVFALGPVLANFPVAALGALVVYAAVLLVDVSGLRRLYAFRRSEALLALATAVAVLTVGVRDGILAAVALSLLDLLRRVARPHDAVLGYVPGLAGMHDVADYPQGRPVPGLMVYRYDSPLFFANAEDFHRRAIAAYEATRPKPRYVLLNLEAVSEIDATAAEALEELRAELERDGVLLALARVKHELRRDLDAAGLTERIGPQLIFPTLPTAVAALTSPEGLQASREDAVE